MSTPAQGLSSHRLVETGFCLRCRKKGSERAEESERATWRHPWVSFNRWLIFPNQYFPCAPLTTAACLIHGLLSAPASFFYNSHLFLLLPFSRSLSKSWLFSPGQVKTQLEWKREREKAKPRGRKYTVKGIVLTETWGRSRLLLNHLLEMKHSTSFRQAGRADRICANELKL